VHRIRRRATWSGPLTLVSGPPDTGAVPAAVDLSTSFARGLAAIAGFALGLAIDDVPVMAVG
jgi:hypothetical protein